MSEFDVNQFLEGKGDPRHLGLVLPHIPSSEFTARNHEKEYPYRLNIPLGWGFRREDAYKIYRQKAIGYCDIREDLEHFSRLDPDKLKGYAAVMFEDNIGTFWFHMPYIETCIVDADELEEAELLYNKTKVFRTRYPEPGATYDNELSPREILEEGYEWQPVVDSRNEPLYLDEAVMLPNGAWINNSTAG